MATLNSEIRSASRTVLRWLDLNNLQNFESTSSHFDLCQTRKAVYFAAREDKVINNVNYCHRNNYSINIQVTEPSHQCSLRHNNNLNLSSDGSAQFRRLQRRRKMKYSKSHFDAASRPHSRSSLSFIAAFILCYCVTVASSNIMLNSDQIMSDNMRPAIRKKYEPFVRFNRCYSCMSAMYEPFFRAENSHLARFFYEPRNFTTHCDDPNELEQYDVGVVPCRAICLTLTQEFTVMGRKTGKLLTMRGCATSLSRFGFYNRTFALFDQYDLCREVLANELFRYDTDSQPIRVCSCMGDRCNGSAVGRSARTARLVDIMLAVALSLFLFQQTICGTTFGR